MNKMFHGNSDVEQGWLDVRNYYNGAGTRAHHINSPFKIVRSKEGGKIVCEFNYSHKTKVLSEITEIRVKGRGKFTARNRKWHDFHSKPVTLGPWGFRWFTIFKDDCSIMSCINTNMIDIIEFYKEEDICNIKIYWLDAASHPQVYCTDKSDNIERQWEFRDGTKTYELNWFNKDIGHIEIPSPLPELYGAAFVLTDHADFITPSTYLPIMYGDNSRPGLIPHGLTATVSLFCISDSLSKTVGCDVHEYKDMADKLTYGGVEIASHSISSHIGAVRSKEWFDTNIKYLTPYNPATWIDHGSNRIRPDNLISMGWDRDSEHYRLDRILHLGYRNLWSGIDLSIDPVNNIGMSTQQHKLYNIVFLRIMERLKNLKPMLIIREMQRIVLLLAPDKVKYHYSWVGAHFSHLIRRMSQSPARSCFDMIRHMLNGLFLMALPANILFVFKKLLSSYRPAECGTIFFESSWYPEMVCFNSIRINDLHDMLSHKSLENLYNNCDVFIGHVYLSDAALHHPQRAFEPVSGGFRIDQTFSAGLQRLASFHRDGKIWVTTLNELANCWRKWRNSRLSLTSEGKLSIEHVGNNR